MTGPVCAVLPDQATVLVVDDFQPSQPLMDLSLEALPRAEIKDLEFSNSSVHFYSKMTSKDAEKVTLHMKDGNVLSPNSLFPLISHNPKS